MTTILVTKGVIEMAPVVSAISSSVKSIFKIVDSLSRKPEDIGPDKYTDSDVHDYLDYLDIRAKLDTYNMLVLEIPHTKAQSVVSSLVSVKNILIEIDGKMSEIEYKVGYNNRLWFLTSLRSYSTTADLKMLSRLIHKLGERMNSLSIALQISKLYNDKLFTGSETPSKSKPDETVEGYQVVDEI